MAFNTFGSTAGGFMTGFLAARRLKMQERFYQQRMQMMDQQMRMQAAYYKWQMGGGASNTNKPPADYLKAAGDAFDARNGRGAVDTTMAAKLVPRMMKDYGLTKEQATGVVGTMGYESGDFKALQEKDPQGGGKGGLGWAQWTNTPGSPRRDQFEAFAKANGLDPNSEDANYGFMKKELASPAYAGVIPAVRNTSTVADASKVWLQKYEGMNLDGSGPGNPAVAQHVQRAEDYYTALNGGAAQGQPTATPSSNPTGTLPTNQYGGHTAYAADGTRVETDARGRSIDPNTGRPAIATQAASPTQAVPVRPVQGPPQQNIPQDATPPVVLPGSALPVGATVDRSSLPLDTYHTTPQTAPSDTPQSSSTATPPAPAPIPVIIPKDEASTDVAPPTTYTGADMSNDYEPTMAARRGGPVVKMARGGPVRAFDLGGSTDDEDADQQFENDATSADYEDRGVGLPNTNPELGLIQPIQGAIPTATQGAYPASPQSGATQVAGNAYTMGSLPRIGSGLGGGGGMRMGGGGGGGVGRAPNIRQDHSTNGNQLSNEDSYYGGLADPNMEPPSDTPRIVTPNGDIAPTASNAIADGLDWLSKRFRAASQSALPTQRGPDDDLLRSGGLSPEELKEGHKAVDPTGSLTSDMRNIALMEASHKWYIDHGQPEEAGKAAAGVIMACQRAAAVHGDEAIQRFHKGDIEGAAQQVVDGYNKVPDAKTAAMQKVGDDQYLVTQLNAQKRALWQKTVGPQEILGAAIGLKNGTMYYNLMSESAAKYDPQIAAQNAQLTPEDQKAFGSLSAWRNGNQGSQGNPPTQAVAVSQAQTATPQSNATTVSGAPAAPPSISPAQGQAIPVAPQPTTPVQAISTAIPSDGQQPTELDPKIVQAHQANLEREIAGYKAQVLDPVMAMRPRPDETAMQQYNSWPVGDGRRKMFEQKLAQEDKDWQETMLAPAQKQFQDLASGAQTAYREQLNSAQSAINNNRTEQFRAAAQTDNQQHADAAAMERERFSKTKEAQIEAAREQAAALLETNRTANEDRNASNQTERNEVSEVQRRLGDVGTRDDYATRAASAMSQQIAPTITQGVLKPHVGAVRDGIVDVMAHNPSISPDEAARSVKALVFGGDGDFKPQAYRNGDRSMVTFKDKTIMPIVIPSSRLAQLTAVQSVVADAAEKQRALDKATADKRADTAQRMAIPTSRSAIARGATAGVQPASEPYRPNALMQTIFPDEKPNPGYGKNGARQGAPLPSPTASTLPNWDAPENYPFRGNQSAIPTQ